MTGSNGFIGKPTVDILRRLGHECVLIDKSSGTDIMDLESLYEKITSECDAVIHLAGLLGTSELIPDLNHAIDVNIKGTLNTLKATNIIGASYVGITMPDVWPSPYQATRVAGQRIAEVFNNAYGLKVTHIKALNGYGPGQLHGEGHPQKIIPTFSYNSWRGIPIPIWGDGNQTVDLVYVDEIAYRLVMAAINSVMGLKGVGSCEVYEAGSGIEASVLDVAHAVGEITGTTLVEFLPMRSGELPNTKLCATNFGKWTPGLVKKELSNIYNRDYTNERLLIKKSVEAYRP